MQLLASLRRHSHHASWAERTSEQSLFEGNHFIFRFYLKNCEDNRKRSVPHPLMGNLPLRPSVSRIRRRRCKPIEAAIGVPVDQVGQSRPVNLGICIKSVWSSSTRRVATTKMARRHGHVPRGQRLRMSVPHGHWKTTTFVGALRLTGMTAPMVLDGPTTAEWFQAYAEQVLAPTLNPGDIVILDNLPARNAAGTGEAIIATGAQLLFLPP
jgi:hypothetical protein